MNLVEFPNPSKWCFSRVPWWCHTLISTTFLVLRSYLEFFSSIYSNTFTELCLCTRCCSRSLSLEVESRPSTRWRWRGDQVQPVTKSTVENRDGKCQEEGGPWDVRPGGHEGLWAGDIQGKIWRNEGREASVMQLQVEDQQSQALGGGEHRVSEEQQRGQDGGDPWVWEVTARGAGEWAIGQGWPHSAQGGLWLSCRVRWEAAPGFWIGHLDLTNILAEVTLTAVLQTASKEARVQRASLARRPLQKPKRDTRSPEDKGHCSRDVRSG